MTHRPIMADNEDWLQGKMDKRGVPDNAARDGMIAYITRHHPVGGFLTALLSNDLVDTFGRADKENGAAIREWVMFLYNDAPAPCWGSREKVQAWLEMRAWLEVRAEAPGGGES